MMCRYVLMYFVLISSVVFSQNYITLTGTVFDAQKQETIPFAVLKLASSQQIKYTNINGSFKFNNLTKVKDQLTVTCLGYTSVTIPITIDLLTSINTLKIELNKSVEQLNEVTIVYDENKIEDQKIETAGFAVKSISTKAVKHHSIEANTLIDQTPGINVRQTGGLGSRSEYTLNGLSGNAVRFFIDGIPMEYYGSSYTINSLPVTLIDRIDVYKGVVPIFLGGDALGGAVNIRTRTNAKNSLNMSYTIGSFNTHKASISGNYIQPKLNFVVRGSAFYNYTDNNYKVWGPDVYVSNPKTGRINRSITATRFNDGFKNFGTKLNFGWVRKKWADQLLIGMLYSNMYKETQHGATMEVPFGERYYTQQTSMPSVSYQKKNFLIKGVNTNLFTGYSVQNRQVIDTTNNKYNWYGQVIKQMPQGGEAGTATLAIAKESTFINRINVAYNVNKNSKVTLNYLYTLFDKFNDDALADIGLRTSDNYQLIKKQIVGISFQNKAFNKRLNTNVFAKYYAYNIDIKETEFKNDVYVPNYYNKQDGNYGYGFATSFWLSKKWLIQTSYENAIRLPTPNEIFGNVAGNILSAHQLKPENSQNINLGFRYTTKNNWNHNFIASGNIFYRDVRSLIQQSTIVVSGVDYFYYENLSKILSKGLDVEFKYNYNKKIAVLIAGSYTDARDKNQYTPDGRKSWSYNSRLKNTPYLQFNTGLKFNFNHLFLAKSSTSVYWNTRYVHAFFRHWENIGKYSKDIIPTQFVNNIGLSYAFPQNKCSISFDVRNLLNKQVFDNFAIQQPGKSFYVKLNYKLM